MGQIITMMVVVFLDHGVLRDYGDWSYFEGGGREVGVVCFVRGSFWLEAGLGWIFY